jgi:hypothetical protein
MHTEEQLKVSLKEIGDPKAALDEHSIVAITNPQGPAHKNDPSRRAHVIKGPE